MGRHASERRRRRRSNLWHWASLFATVVGGVSVAALSDVPFGSAFELSLLLLLAGLLVFLLLSALRLVRGRVLWRRGIGFLFLLLAILLTALVAVVAVDHRILVFGGWPPRLTTEQWREDIRCLAEQMAEGHPGLFSLVAEETFWSEADELERAVPELSESQIVMEMFRLLALPRDGHSFPLLVHPAFDLHLLPLRVWFFEDGFYVIAAGRDERDLVGTRIVEIGGHPVEEVFERSRSYLAGGNALSSRERFALIAMVSEWLESQGIIDDARRPRLTVEREAGERRVVTLKPVKALPWIWWYLFRRVDDSAPHQVIQRREKPFSFELQEETGTLLLRWHAAVARAGKETVAQFADRLAEFARSHEFERTVVDLRSNGGGGGGETFDIVRAVRETPQINRRGRLFVLTNRATYSAAVLAAAMLQNSTTAILVGEPTGQGPIFYGRPRQVQLPNSRLVFLVSSHLSQASFPEDGRDGIAPDLPVRASHADFVAGRDPVMKAALDYVAEPREAAVPDELLVGRYLVAPGLVLLVEERDGGLAFSITDFIETSYLYFASRLYPLTETEYSTDIDGARLTFEREPEGQAQRVRFTWGAIERTAERIDEGYRLPMELIAAGEREEGIRRLLAQAEEMRRAHPGLETSFNLLGYRHLGEERYDDAIAMFTLNTELYPASANTWDSLGEAYMERGDREKAIESYQKSLELDPLNRNAEKALAKLRGR